MWAVVWAIVKQNWKLIAIVIAAISVYFWYQHQMDVAFNNGVTAEKSRWEEKIKVEDNKNREFEAFLNKRMDQYEVLIEKRNDTRVVKENTHTTTIKEIVKNNPVYEKCIVDQQLLDERNAIRELGPKK